MTESILRALSMAFAMGWEILWPLILGFTLSAVVQAVVSHREMARLLPDDRPRSIATALALGAASSSCSYAAVALARALFRKGANFTAAMAFEMASTNLVAELSIIMLAFLGWELTLAEFVGAPIMVGLLVLLFRRFLSWELLEEAKTQADKGIAGRMEGHAEMDMSVTEGTLWQRMTSEKGLTAISHYFVMDWAAVWLDIVGGLLIAGALAAWVPPDFWQSFFLVDHPLVAKLWGPIVGPLVAVVSFVCSVGNIPLAAVLWNGPPDEPPLLRVVSKGFRVHPKRQLSHVPRKPMVGLLVLPTTMAPPRLSIRSAKTQEAFTVKFFSARMPPKVAGQPGLKSNRSLIATGTPCRGPKGSPASTAFSASRARARASSKAV